MFIVIESFDDFLREVWVMILVKFSLGNVVFICEICGSSYETEEESNGVRGNFGYGKSRRSCWRQSYAFPESQPPLRAFLPLIA